MGAQTMHENNEADPFLYAFQSLGFVASLSNHNMQCSSLLTPLSARLAENTLDYHLLIFSVK